LRRAGKFSEANEKYQSALTAFSAVLGAAQYLAVTALMAADSMSAYAAASKDDRDDLAESDRQEAEGQAAMKAGKFVETRGHAEKALEIRERILGKNHHELIEPLRLLGNSQTELHKLGAARDALQRGVTIAEQSFGRMHPRTAEVLDRQGWQRLYEREYLESAKAFRRAAYILRSTVGETALTAETLDNFGTALAYSEDKAEALRIKLRGLVIREKLLGPEAADTGVSLSNLAWLYQRIGLTKEVLPLRERALAIFEKAHGNEHRDTKIEMANMAQVYMNAGRIGDAAKLYEKLVAMDESDTTGRGRLDVVGHLVMLGTAYLEADRFEDGETTMARARAAADRVYQSGETGVAISEMNKMSVVFQSRRMLDAASDVSEQVRSWDKTFGATSNEARARREVQYGRLLIKAGKAKEARRVLEEAVRFAKEAFGAQSKEVADPTLAMAEALEADGRLDEASGACGEALRLAEQFAGEDSQLAAYGMELMGRIRMGQGNLDLAAFAFEEGRHKYESAPRFDLAQFLSLQREFGICMIRQGRKEEGLKSLRDALDRARAVQRGSEGFRQSLLASSIKQLLDGMELAGGDETAEREKLTSELRERLTWLRDRKSLGGDQKAWLGELGIVEHK
jgi:tetratricopeptide (TPR) repeat protein